MPSTEDNLKTAFAGESQANRKYLAFAKKAEKEGFANIAKLFKTAAEAETIHALGHFESLDGVGSTVDNLKAAFGGETHEYTEMYPPMIEQAQAEGHKGARMMRYANQAEAVHASLYAKALEAAASGVDINDTQFYLCPFCGNVEAGSPPDKCSICGNPGKGFILV